MVFGIISDQWCWCSVEGMCFYLFGFGFFVDLVCSFDGVDGGIGKFVGQYVQCVEYEGYVIGYYLRCWLDEVGEIQCQCDGEGYQCDGVGFDYGFMVVISGSYGWCQWEEDDFQFVDVFVCCCYGNGQ